MNIQGLKPCPFCGGNAIEVSPYDQKPLGSRWIIKCVDCGASIQGSHRAMNKAAWNQRVHEPRTGTWLPERIEVIDGEEFITGWRCSECGAEQSGWVQFCGRCGADMGGKKSDDGEREAVNAVQH